MRHHTRKKPSEKEASGDGDGFEAISSVGLGESTSLSMKRKSPIKARKKSKVAGSKKKTSNAAASTSEEPPSQESDGQKCPPEQLVALEKQKGKVAMLDSFSAKLPNHGNRDSHVNTFSLFQQSLEKAGIAARGNLPPLARPSIV